MEEIALLSFPGATLSLSEDIVRLRQFAIVLLLTTELLITTAVSASWT